MKLAAIGPGTAEELARYHLRADVVPAEFRAESLAEALIAAVGEGDSPRLHNAKRRVNAGRTDSSCSAPAAGGKCWPSG